MNQIKKALDQHVSVPTNTKYRATGVDYIQVLIAEDGKVRSIGEYLTALDNFHSYVGDELASQFAQDGSV